MKSKIPCLVKILHGKCLELNLCTLSLIHLVLVQQMQLCWPPTSTTKGARQTMLTVASKTGT